MSEAGGAPLTVYLVKGFVNIVRTKRPWHSGMFYKDRSDKTDPGHYLLLSPPHDDDRLRQAYEAGQAHGCTFAEWKSRQEREKFKTIKPGVTKR